MVKKIKKIEVNKKFSPFLNRKKSKLKKTCKSYDYIHWFFLFCSCISDTFARCFFSCKFQNLGLWPNFVTMKIKLKNKSNFLTTFSLMPFVIASEAKLHPTWTFQVQIIRCPQDIILAIWADTKTNVGVLHEDISVLEFFHFVHKIIIQ